MKAEGETMELKWQILTALQENRDRFLSGEAVAGE